MELEKDIEKYLLKRVTAIGGKAYKFVSPSHRGVADRVVCLPGQTWFVELKRQDGRLSPLQQIFAGDMLALEQNYIVLWSKQQVDEWFSEITKKTQ